MRARTRYGNATRSRRPGRAPSDDYVDPQCRSCFFFVAIALVMHGGKIAAIIQSRGAGTSRNFGVLLRQIDDLIRANARMQDSKDLGIRKFRNSAIPGSSTILEFEYLAV